MDVSLKQCHDLSIAVTDMIATASQVPGCIEQLMEMVGKEGAVGLDLVPSFKKEAVQ